jgi:ABC-type Fe3+-hydroxamate transport system substrate-binding protein
MTNGKVARTRWTAMHQFASSFGFRHSSFIREFGFRHFPLLFVLAFSNCNQPAPPPATQPITTIASTVPAATDLLVGMGAQSHLVAVSSYDDVDHLPKAGDYQTIDWELLASLHPSVLITQMKPELQSAGFKARAAGLHITPVNVQIENLDDIFNAIDVLGNALKDTAMSAAAKHQMHDRLAGVRNRVAGEKAVRTLIVTGGTPDFIAAPGGYLDDLLNIAGGVNAAPASSQHWPSIDREKLLSLQPDAIIQLMPGASSQEKQQAAGIWKQYPQIPAVAAGRVYPINADYALKPGWHVTDLAEQFSRCLHP